MQFFPQNRSWFLIEPGDYGASCTCSGRFEKYISVSNLDSRRLKQFHISARNVRLIMIKPRRKKPSIRHEVEFDDDDSTDRDENTDGVKENATLPTSEELLRINDTMTTL